MYDMIHFDHYDRFEVAGSVGSSLDVQYKNWREGIQQKSFTSLADRCNGDDEFERELGRGGHLIALSFSRLTLFIHKYI